MNYIQNIFISYQKIILKATLFVIAALIIFSPTNSFAADSVTYSIAGKMIDATERFTLSLYFSIANAYYSVYIKIATIGLILILSKYLFTRVPPLREMIGFSIAMMISSSIAFDPELFKTLIYDTFFDTLYRFDQFVIQSSASNMPGIKLISFNSLSGMFKTVDMSLMGISNFALETAHNIPLLSTNGFALRIEAYVIFLLYLFIGAYFLIIFTISIFGAHMMIIAMPITISLYPFKRFRHYLSNCVSGMFHYGLVTIFACIAISLVVFISDDLVLQSDKMAAEVAAGGESDIPADFLTGAIMIGFLSIFIIKVSTEFASRVLNSASSQLGGAFPMIVAGATTLAKSAPMITSGIKFGASGLGSTSRFVNNKFSKS